LISTSNVCSCASCYAAVVVVVVVVVIVVGCGCRIDRTGVGIGIGCSQLLTVFLLLLLFPAIRPIIAAADAWQLEDYMKYFDEGHSNHELADKDIKNMVQKRAELASVMKFAEKLLAMKNCGAPDFNEACHKLEVLVTGFQA
jgi:hypothetical protein